MEPRSCARSKHTSSCMRPLSQLSLCASISPERDEGPPSTFKSPAEVSALGSRQCTKCTLDRRTVSISASYGKTYNIVTLSFKFFSVWLKLENSLKLELLHNTQHHNLVNKLLIRPPLLTTSDGHLKQLVSQYNLHMKVSNKS